MSSEDAALRVSLGRARIEALPKDPYSAWIYWEITAESVRNALGAISEIPDIELHIRTRPADSEPIVTTSYIVDHWVDGRFISGLQPGTPFDAVLAVHTPDGIKHIATSPLKRAPRDRAGHGAPTFVTVSRDPEGGFEMEVTDHAPPGDALEPSSDAD